MTSAIDNTKPVAGNPTTASVRTNFTIARDEISALQLRNAQIGFMDYADTATTGSPIAVAGTNTFTDLTNNGLGVTTNKAYKPPAVGEIWNTSTNRLNFVGSLKPGDMVDARLDFTVTTTSANQIINVSLFLQVGLGSEFELPFVSSKQFKSAGTYRVTEYIGFYIGSALTRDNPGRFRIKSDASATCVVNGFYFKLDLIGDHP